MALRPHINFSLESVTGLLIKIRQTQKEIYFDLPEYAGAIDEAATILINLFDTYLVILKQREFVYALATVIIHYQVLKIRASLPRFPPTYDLLLDLLHSTWGLNEDRELMETKFVLAMSKLLLIEALRPRNLITCLPQKYYDNLQSLPPRTKSNSIRIMIKEKTANDTAARGVKQEEEDLFRATEDVKILAKVLAEQEAFVLYRWMGEEWAF